MKTWNYYADKAESELDQYRNWEEAGVRSARAAVYATLARAAVEADKQRQHVR